MFNRFSAFLFCISLLSTPVFASAQETDESEHETMFIQFTDVDVFGARDRPMGETFVGPRDIEFPSLLDLDPDLLPKVSRDANVL